MNRYSPKNLTLAVLILLAVVAGCSDSGNAPKDIVKKSVPPEYTGMWTAADGSTVTFRNDWTGDYKSGGKSVSGGSFEIDEAAKEIRFSLMGFDAGKYKIDEPPKKNRMKLDGMEYRRSDGFSTGDSNEKSGDEIPTESELQTLASETLKNLDEAIQLEDFTEFHVHISDMWRKKITAAELQKAFAETIHKKADYRLQPNATLNFTGHPKLENEGNTFDLRGNYPTTKNTEVGFRLRYVKENDEWKLLGVYLNPDNLPEKEK